MNKNAPRPVYLHIQVLADTDATVAVAVMDGIVLTASAKREPGDRPDMAIGRDLATARVLAKAARRLERRARGAVRHADNVKTARRAARERAANEPADGAVPVAGARTPVRVNRARTANPDPPRKGTGR